MIYYAHGSALVTPEELHEPKTYDRIDKDLAGLREGSDEAKALQEKRVALTKNIFEDLLKPKA